MKKIIIIFLISIVFVSCDLINYFFPNEHPVADAGADISIGYDATVTLNGTGSSDSDGDSLSYTWYYIDVPDTNNVPPLYNYRSAEPYFDSGSTDGDFVLALVVNDGKIDSAPDTVIITVGP